MLTMTSLSPFWSCLVLLCCGFRSQITVPLRKPTEIGPSQSQRMTVIFGVLVPNDRAAEWVEGE